LDHLLATPTAAAVADKFQLLRPIKFYSRKTTVGEKGPAHLRKTYTRALREKFDDDDDYDDAMATAALPCVGWVVVVLVCFLRNVPHNNKLHENNKQGQGPSNPLRKEVCANRDHSSEPGMASGWLVAGATSARNNRTGCCFAVVGSAWV
jgi:hypothetical protein